MTKRNVGLAQNCKLCRLSRADKALWLEVHRRVLDDGLSHSIVCEWLNGQIKVKGLDFKPFNETNFSSHFRKHITNDEIKKKTLRQLMLSETEKGSKAYTEDEREEAEVLLSGKPGSEEKGPDPKEEDLEYYKFLQKALLVAQKHLKQYEQLLESTTTKNTPQGYYQNLEGYYKLLTDLSKIQESIAKTKASEQVAGQAVYIAVELVATSIITTLVDIVKEAETLLSQELPGSRLPSEVSKMILERTRTRATDVSNDIIKRVYTTFNIK